MRLAAALVGMWMRLRRGGPASRAPRRCAACCYAYRSKAVFAGLRFRSARSSSMLRAGTPVFTTTTIGTTPPPGDGLDVLLRSKPSLMRLRRDGLPGIGGHHEGMAVGRRPGRDRRPACSDAPGRFSTTTALEALLQTLSASRRENDVDAAARERRRP